MNRTVALLIPAVLLAAMALIVFQQFYTSQDEPLTAQSAGPGTNSPQPASSPSEGNHNLPAALSGEPAGQAEPASAENLQAAQGAENDAPKPEQPVQGEIAAQPTPAAPEAQPGEGAGREKETAKPESAAAAGSEKSEPPAAEVPPAPKSEPAKKFKAQGFSFQYQGNDMLFTITADSPIEYKSFVLTSPDRLIVDLLGSWSGVENISVPSNRLISGMRNGKTERGHRVVLDLKQAPKGYDIKRDGNKLIVTVF